MDIDLNCDMGESFGVYKLGRDEAVLPYITSVNIACGFHAGGPQEMMETVRLAKKYGAAVGAHPGYPDLAGFGRRSLDMTPEEVEACVLYQVGALWSFTRAVGAPMVHLKPHGALYNLAARDRATAAAIVRATASFSKDLILVGLAGSMLIEMGIEAGLKVANEGFPERAYEPDGSLRSRRLPGAVIEDPQAVALQAKKLIREGIGLIRAGQAASIPVDTLCIHGDNPGVVDIVRKLRIELAAEGIVLKALS